MITQTLENDYVDFNLKARMRRKGQSVLEYTLIIAVVVAALSAMSLYVRRSVQANLKTIEDQINAPPNKSATGSSTSATAGGFVSGGG